MLALDAPVTTQTLFLSRLAPFGISGSSFQFSNGGARSERTFIGSGRWDIGV